MTKKILFTVVCFYVFSACKTIEVQESWAFVASKYDELKYTEYVNNSDEYSTSEKENNIEIINRVINSNEVEITEKNHVKLQRHFMKSEEIEAEYFVFEPEKINRTGLFFIGNGSNILNYSHHLFELSRRANAKIYVLT